MPVVPPLPGLDPAARRWARAVAARVDDPEPEAFEDWLGVTVFAPLSRGAQRGLRAAARRSHGTWRALRDALALTLEQRLWDPAGQPVRLPPPRVTEGLLRAWTTIERALVLSDAASERRLAAVWRRLLAESQWDPSAPVPSAGHVTAHADLELSGQRRRRWIWVGGERGDGQALGHPALRAEQLVALAPQLDHLSEQREVLTNPSAPWQADRDRYVSVLHDLLVVTPGARGPSDDARRRMRDLAAEAHPSWRTLPVWLVLDGAALRYDLPVELRQLAARNAMAHERRQRLLPRTDPKLLGALAQSPSLDARARVDVWAELVGRGPQDADVPSDSPVARAARAAWHDALGAALDVARWQEDQAGARPGALAGVIDSLLGAEEDRRRVGRSSVMDRLPRPVVGQLLRAPDRALRVRVLAGLGAEGESMATAPAGPGRRVE